MSEYFEPEQAIGEMLCAGILILNVHWWEKDWPEDARNRGWAVAVNCNDIFYPAADAEELLYDEVEDLYEMWRKDKNLGYIAWCIKKRKQKPWGRFSSIFEKSSVWNINELIEKS